MILCVHQTPSHGHPHLPSSTSSRRYNRPFRRPSPPQHQQKQRPPPLLRFHTEYQEKLQYLVGVGIVPSVAPSRASLDRVIDLIDYLKAAGISDTHLPKLTSCCPQLFTSGLHPDDISPVFHFLTSDTDLSASPDDAAGLVLRCPHLLLSSVDHRLRPTLRFLRSIGVPNLTVPNHLNAHLLNTRLDRLLLKIEWLVHIGFRREEAEAACARMRALFGYSITNCMLPKYEYLAGEMGRGVDELKDFPQYFGFSLVNRIAPRHSHLKHRGVRVSLRDLLVCADDKFYNRWT